MTDDKEAKHLEIVRKHQFNVHKELGEMYGYPKCCIEQFCVEQDNDILSAQHRERTHGRMLPPNLLYVPCDKCFIKMILDNI